MIGRFSRTHRRRKRRRRRHGSCGRRARRQAPSTGIRIVEEIVRQYANPQYANGDTCGVVDKQVRSNTGRD